MVIGVKAETGPARPLAQRRSRGQTSGMVEPVTVLWQECGAELAGDSPDLRLELTCDDEPIVYCAECWEREFGEQDAG